MASDLHGTFINKLIENFGDHQPITSRFGSHSYGDIADILCISASQFSKLSSGTATEGMYIRSIKNIEQIQEYEMVREENKLLEYKINTLRKNQTSTVLFTRRNLFSLIAVLLTASLSFFFLQFSNSKLTNKQELIDPSFVLTEFFDRDYRSEFMSPYVNVANAQQYCPCSAYEGMWTLEDEYVIPLPGRKPGLYYLAKGLDQRLKCILSADDFQKGKRMIGFEQMYHEIWIDKNREPLTPKYFNLETKTYTAAFDNLDFEKNSNFELAAKIKSFQFNDFLLSDTTIRRIGEPTGRYASFINNELVEAYQIDIKDILQNVIGSALTFECQDAQNAFCDPNDLGEGSVLTFNCEYNISTENLGINGGYPYTKGYKLVKQNYSDNLLCDCKE